MNNKQKTTQPKEQGGPLAKANAAALPDTNVGLLWQRIVADCTRLFMAIHYKLFRQQELSLATVVKVGFLLALTYYVLVGDVSIGRSASTAPAHESYFGLLSAPKPEVSLEVLFADQPTDSPQEKQVKAYIRRFKEVAQQEQKKFGIPASISMAQGILESNSGQSRLATKTNNHFGIKCFSKKCSKGHCTNFSDDHHKDFFIKYGTAWESWRAHSHLLNGARYKDLQQHGVDYTAWARGLKEKGYATASDYDERLIRTIETYQLHRLDQ